MAVNIPIITEFVGAGVDKAIKQFKQLETVGEKASFAIKKAAVPAAAALAGLGALALDFAKAAAEDEAAAAQLAKQLKNSTGATNGQVAAIEKYITKTSMAVAVTDDKLRPALTNLVRATSDTTRSQKLLSVALDISASTGKDLETVSIALAKAENGQYTALKKLGVPMGENATAQQDMAKFGTALQKVQREYTAALEDTTISEKDRTKLLAKVQEAQEKLNGVTIKGADYVIDLDKAFGGAADTAAGTAAGAFARMNIALSETKESIGAALLPIVQVMADKFAAIGQLAQENSGLFVTLAAVIGGIAISVLAVNTAMKIYTAYTKLAAAATFLWNAALAANPVVLVGIAIAALVGGLVIAYNKFDSFRNLVDTLFDGMKTGFAVVVNVIRGYIETLVGFYKGLFNGIADIWNNTVGKLKFKIPGWVPVIGGKGFEVPEIPKRADGGIVQSATLALIGEKGPEAVIPLSGRNVPNMGNNITINVNGGDPNAVVAALRTYMRQNGSIPIRTSNIF